MQERARSLDDAEILRVKAAALRQELHSFGTWSREVRPLLEEKIMDYRGQVYREARKHKK